MSNQELLTPKAAAALLKVSMATLYAWRKADIGPKFHRLGWRTVRYPRSQLEAWMEETPSRPAKPQPANSLRIEA